MNKEDKISDEELEQATFKPDASKPVDPHGNSVNAMGVCSECSNKVPFRMDPTKQESDSGRPYQWVHCPKCETDQKVYCDGDGFQANLDSPG